MARFSTRGRVWNALRRKVIRLAGWKCSRCGKAGRLEVHHIVPIAKGGARFALKNLEVICRRCHFDEHKSSNADRLQWCEFIGLKS